MNAAERESGRVAGGIWRCGECGEVVRLTRGEEAAKAAVRCTGVPGDVYGSEARRGGGGSSHWPVRMERVGVVRWGWGSEEAESAESESEEEGAERG